MTIYRPVERVLISVSDKTGITAFASDLADAGAALVSTGGTANALRDSGLNVQDVSELTNFPEMMDGRIKTLHPGVHGGLLAVRDNAEHMRSAADHGIVPIDLAVINLYPFEETLARGGTFDECVENIDIGGPAMLRAAAKNHAFVGVVTDPDDYESVAAEIKEHGGLSDETRRRLAAKTFALTAYYDSKIASWLSKEVGDEFPKHFSVAGLREQELRYGENPHQAAAIYKTGSTRNGVGNATLLQGKALSYNNYNDTDAAFELIADFDPATPAVAIIKHANPCGVSVASNLCEAYDLALRCDPVSAFGGIVACNQEIDGALAEKIVKVFTEVVIAPGLSDDAKAVFSKKKNLRVLASGSLPGSSADQLLFKPVGAGILVQSADAHQLTQNDLTVVTKKQPTDQQIDDLLFAFTVAKHVKSNAIVYAKDGAAVGIGAGQMSRLDSSRIAARKALDAAEACGAEQSLAIGSVVASDAFFPFADGLLAAAEAGAEAIIQPGGSMRDDDVIKAADEAGLAMAMTGVRHFRH